MLGLQELRQRQAKRRQAANLQEATSRNSGTIGRATGEKREHQIDLKTRRPWREVGCASSLRLFLLGQIPLSNAFLKNAVGGWQLSGIVTMESGAPINLGVSGNNVCGTVPNCAVRPNQIGAVNYPNSATTFSSSGNNTVLWFDPSAFVINFIPGSTTATFGNVRKNALRGPGRDNWNLALFKQIAFTERLRSELRLEAYNVWNHTQFKGDVNNGGISTGIGGGPDVGKISSAYDARTLQLGVKVIF